MELLKYRFKCILKTRGVFAQCILFPIIVATLCYTSLERAHSGHVSEGNQIAIGIVADDTFSTDVFDKNRFDVYRVPEVIASRYLEEGVITSYIRIADEPELITLRYEEEQRITKVYFDAYLAGISPAMLQDRHMIQESEEQEPSILLSNFMKLVMAAVCTSIAGILLITLINKSKRQLAVRSNLAAIPEAYMLLQDIVVIVSILIGTFIILYGYIYFILQK